MAKCDRTAAEGALLQGPDGRRGLGRHAGAGGPGRKGHAELARGHAVDLEARRRQHGPPFDDAIVPYMGGVTQQLHGLEMRIGGAIRRRNAIHEHRKPARLQDAPGLGEPALDLGPVMRREAAQHRVEFRLGEGQALGGSLPRRDIGEALVGGRAGHGFQHGRRHVAGYHGGDMRGGAVADMAAAAAEIEHPPGAGIGRAQHGLHLVEVGALAVIPALHIGLGTRGVVMRRELVLRRGPRSSFSCLGASRRYSSTAAATLDVAACANPRSALRGRSLSWDRGTHPWTSAKRTPV